MKRIHLLLLSFLFIIICCKDNRKIEGTKLPEVKFETDTTIILKSLEFNFLNYKVDLTNFEKLAFSDSVSLQKITSIGLMSIDTTHWNERLGSIPYLFRGLDSLFKDFNHGNYEGEDFYLVSRHQNSGFVWTIIGGFCGENICTYHLLIQNAEKIIVFFQEVGFVGFNYNPIKVEYLKNDTLKYLFEICMIDDYTGAVAEIETLETTLVLNPIEEKVFIHYRKSIWNAETCY